MRMMVADWDNRTICHPRLLSSPSVNEHRERDIIAHCEGRRWGRFERRAGWTVCVVSSVRRSHLPIPLLQLRYYLLQLQQAFNQ